MLTDGDLQRRLRNSIAPSREVCWSRTSAIDIRFKQGRNRGSCVGVEEDLMSRSWRRNRETRPCILQTSVDGIASIHV